MPFSAGISGNSAGNSAGTSTETVADIGAGAGLSRGCVAAKACARVMRLSVYVDPLSLHGRSSSSRWGRSCHLFADTVEELHDFAARLGLRRDWFQDKPKLPHYDLNDVRREAAMELGATELGRRAAVEKWRELRLRSMGTTDKEA